MNSKDKMDEIIRRKAKENGLNANDLTFYFKHQFQFVRKRMQELDPRPVFLYHLGMFLVKKKYTDMLNDPKKRTDMLLEIKERKDRLKNNIELYKRDSRKEKNDDTV